MIRFGGLFVCLFVTFAASARAQERPSTMPSELAFVRSACEVSTVEWGAVERVIRAELSNDNVALVTLANAGPSAHDLASLRLEPETCDERAVTFVAILVAPGRAESQSLTLRVGDVEPSLRARVLALAVVDFVRGLWPRLPAPAPAPAPAPPAVPVEAPSAANDEVRRGPVRERAPLTYRLQIGPEIRLFPKDALVLFGGRAAFSVAPSSFPISILAGLGASTGTVEVAAGVLDVTLYTVAFGASYRLRLGAFSLGFGARLDLGAAILTGTMFGVSPVSKSAFVSTLSGDLALGYTFAEDFHVEFGTSAGFTIAAVDVATNGASNGGVRGAALAFRVGIGYSF